MFKKTTIAAILSTVVAAPAFAGSLQEPVIEPVVAPSAAAEYYVPAQPVATVSKGSWEGLYGGMTVGKEKIKDPKGSDLEVGMHLGYAKDFGVVIGAIEADFTPIGIPFDNIDGEMNAALAVKAKVGYDMGDVLPYVTLGQKYAKADLDGKSRNDVGTVVGLGVDFALDPNVVVGGELTHTTFDDFDGTGYDIEQNKLALKVSIRF